jgi:hypothetical protein
MPGGTIPNWNARGVLPPFDPVSPTSSPGRSPYEVSLTDMVLRYATSPERCGILDGYMRFREALNTVGLQQGFQWLDGSFLEYIELIENRPPRDIDVVTFYHLPSGMTQRELQLVSPTLFIPTEAKNQYHVDAYFVQLNASHPEPLVKLTTYWYSVWSHRRDELWKGYLQVDLAPTDNAAARANLTAMGAAPGGTP